MSSRCLHTADIIGAPRARRGDDLLRIDVLEVIEVSNAESAVLLRRLELMALSAPHPEPEPERAPATSALVTPTPLAQRLKRTKITGRHEQLPRRQVAVTAPG